ncbi:MAG: LpxI family protein, partial [Pirellulales bacterium]|nr:LpxI family protein [Pirellulales bacterium]
VIAVEAVEGTDRCIERAGQLCRGGGFTVVKVAKPQQDMRFDVPTVGIRTLQTMLAGGGKVLAVEADRTILLEQPEFVDFANQNRLIVVSLIRPDVAVRPSNESEPPDDHPRRPAEISRQPHVPEWRS